MSGSPILVEKGADPRVLVIAFTGFKGGLGLPTFDFFRQTKLTPYSRILTLDTSLTCYLGGMPPLYADYASLLAGLREHIARLAPQKLMFIGASSGGFAAILFGHELKADYVHAFSPYTYVGRRQCVKNEDKQSIALHAETVDRIDALPAAVHPFFDLQPILARHNGKTRYYLHVCRGSPWDFMRVRRLERLPGTLVAGYPCDGHGVAVVLARAGLIGDLLDIGNQERMAEVLRERLARKDIQWRARDGDADRG